MAVDHDVDIRPDGFAYRSHAVDADPYRRPKTVARHVGRSQVVEGRQLHARETVVDGAHGVARETLWAPVFRGAVDVGVHTQRVAHAAAQETVSGRVERLAEYVPQGVLHRADRSVVRASLVRGVEPRVELFYVPNAGAFEARSQRVQRGFRGVVSASL